MGMKAALALAFVVALTVPLDQLEGKGMGFRFPLFMLSAAVVPLAWRRRFSPYERYWATEARNVVDHHL